MNATPFVLLSLGGVKLTVFGIFIALGLLGCVLASLWNGKHIRVRRSNIIDGCFYALIIGFALSRLVYVAVQFLYYADEIDKPAAMFKLWDGGYSIFGAVFGAFIGMTLLSRRISFRRISDALTPGLLLMIGIWRFGEIFTYQGRGIEAHGFFAWFPFALNNAGGTPCVAVCVFEAVVAFALCWYALNVRSTRRRSGESAYTAWLLFALAQVVLESMRKDDYLRNGFVKVEQVMAMGLAVAMIVAFLRGYIKYSMDWKIGGAALGLTAVFIGMCIWEEFKIDGSLHVWLNHTFMALYALALAIVALFLREGWRKQPGNASGQPRRDILPAGYNPRDARSVGRAARPQQTNARQTSQGAQASARPGAYSSQRVASYSDAQYSSQRPAPARSNAQYSNQRPVSARSDAQYSNQRPAPARSDAQYSSQRPAPARSDAQYSNQRPVSAQPRQASAPRTAPYAAQRTADYSNAQYSNQRPQSNTARYTPRRSSYQPDNPRASRDE